MATTTRTGKHSQLAQVIARRTGKPVWVATNANETKEQLLKRANATRVIKRVNTNPALKLNPTLSGLKNELTQVDRDIAELETDPFYGETPGRKAYRAKWLAYHRRQRRKLEQLMRDLERAAKRRSNGIVEAAAGLQALEYIGAKAKKSGLGRKPKYNPEMFVVRWWSANGNRLGEHWFYSRGKANEFADTKDARAAFVAIYSVIKGYFSLVDGREPKKNPAGKENRFLIQVVSITGKREQLTTNSEKQAKETAASWYSRGASVTVVDRKKKTQTVYGTKNPVLLANRYRVTGTQRRTRFYLQSNKLATGFIEKAEVFNGPDSAQRAADQENRSKVWGFKWRIERFTKPISTNPRVKGSRDVLGVFHAENPSGARVGLGRYPQQALHKSLNQRVRKAEMDQTISSARARYLYSLIDKGWPAYSDNSPEQRTARQKAKQEIDYLLKTRNPSVADLSRTFQGEADGSIDRLYAADNAPANIARAGKLVFLKVNSKTFRLPGAMVGIAPNGKLWITGAGALFETKARKGEGLDVGEVSHICYETAKAHIGNGKTFEYVHEFGEEGGRRPHLIIDHEGMPILRGGDYKIRAEGIVN